MTDASKTNDYFKCWTPIMDKATTQTLVLTFNKKSQTADVIIAPSAPTILSITPSDPSPVLKRTLTINVDPSYTGNLETDFANKKLDVWLRDTAGKRADKQINVVAADNGAKTITVKFGGHYSGLYDVVLNHKVTGPFGGAV